jgi:hypothetical protein
VIWSRADFAWAAAGGLAMFAMLVAGLPVWSALAVLYAVVSVRMWQVVVRPLLRGEPVQSPPHRRKRAPSA